MNERIKASILYTSLVGITCALIFLNHDASLLHLKEDTSPLLVPLVSCGIIFFIMMLLWWREKSIEEQEYQFITIVTHKFRTPLTGIKWAIDAFKKEESYEERVDTLKQMENNSNKLMEIVDLLIGFVKFNQKLEYAFEAAVVQEMVQESIEKYRQHIREKNMNFSIHSDPDIPLVVIDRRKIQFVIDMLIDNAIKYTPAEGQIAVSVKLDKKNIVVAVEDSGIGMSSGEINHLFKKFYRSADAKTIDTEGLGMGLHAAHVIMKHHGGRIYATSKGKNAGSTFYIEIPLSQ